MRTDVRGWFDRLGYGQQHTVIVACALAAVLIFTALVMVMVMRLTDGVDERRLCQAHFARSYLEAGYQLDEAKFLSTFHCVE